MFIGFNLQFRQEILVLVKKNINFDRPEMVVPIVVRQHDFLSSIELNG